jgi:hypothetical protein
MAWTWGVINSLLYICCCRRHVSGVLVAAVLALALKLTEGERLGRQGASGNCFHVELFAGSIVFMCFVATAACQRILEAMLPNAWRTASPGFAGCGVRTKLSEQKDGKEF